MREAVRSSDEGATLRCPLCHDALGAVIERCAGCDTPYHPGCRRELGRCATLGCAEAAAPPRRAGPRPVRAPWAVPAGEGVPRPADDAAVRGPAHVAVPSLLRRGWWWFVGSSFVPMLLVALIAMGVGLAVRTEALAPHAAIVLLGLLAALRLGTTGRRAR